MVIRENYDKKVRILSNSFSVWPNQDWLNEGKVLKKIDKLNETTDDIKIKALTIITDKQDYDLGEEISVDIEFDLDKLLF